MHCWFQSLCQVTVFVFGIGPFSKLVFFYFGLHRHWENLIIFRYIYVPSLFLDSKSSYDINIKNLAWPIPSCFDMFWLWNHCGVSKFFGGPLYKAQKQPMTEVKRPGRVGNDEREQTVNQLLTEMDGAWVNTVMLHTANNLKTSMSLQNKEDVFTLLKSSLFRGHSLVSRCIKVLWMVQKSGRKTSWGW